MRTVGCLAILLAACSSSGSTTAEEPRPPAAPTNGTMNASMRVDPEPKKPPGPPTEPTDRDAEFDATVAQVLVVFAAMGKAVDDGAGDCPRTATALTAVLDEPAHQRVIAANQAFAEDAALRGRLETWTAAHMDELVDVLTKIQTASAQCKDDRGFQAFMVRFQAL